MGEEEEDCRVMSALQCNVTNATKVLLLVRQNDIEQSHRSTFPDIFLDHT